MQFDDRAVRYSGDNAGSGGCRNTQRQGCLHGRDLYDRSGRTAVRDRSRRFRARRFRGRTASKRPAQRAHQRVGCAGTALIIEGKDLLAVVSERRHPHGTALAQARAVAIAPGRDCEPAGRRSHAPQLVIVAVYAHGQRTFQFAEDIKRQASRA